MTRTPVHPKTIAVTGADPGAPGRRDDRAVSRVTAADPRWLKLALAAVLGTVAGTLLFSTRAEGEAAGRRRPRR